MFQNISLSFLCALAFISWSVLCYLHVIEEQQAFNDYNVELYTERPTSTDVPQYCPHKSTQSNFSQRGYEMLISYGLILATTVALSKLLQWLELQTRICLQKDGDSFIIEDSISSIAMLPLKLNTKQIAETKEKEPKTFSPPPLQCYQENVELKEQLNDLQVRCKELLQELRAVNSNNNISSDTDLRCNPSNSSFSGSDASTGDDDNSGVILWKQPVAMKSSGLSVQECYGAPSSTFLAQNVYVTHSHFHVNFNGAVNLSEQNINIGLRPKNVCKRSEFLQVMSTFIKGPKKRPMLTGINNILI